MSTTPSQRDLQKARTRRALLDAGLALLKEQSLSSLGLREITRAVGISPAAFYRHFRDVSDLGVALVEESLGSLHEVIRSGLTEHSGDGERIDHLVDALAAHVRDHPEHIRFVAGERHGGVAAVRVAIGAELDRFAEEVAHLLAGDEVSRNWSAEDLRMLGETYVDLMVMTASAFLEAAQGEGPPQDAVAHAARRRLRLISLGRRHWTSEQAPDSDGSASPPFASG